MTALSVAPSAPAPAAEAGFGLYVHWPFCRAKCPYCDFNSHVVADFDEDAWRQALLTDLDHALHQMTEAGGKIRPLSSIFFGGGTPSLMPPPIMAEIIERAVHLCGATDNCEVTAEANPTSTETATLRAFREAGINRVSLGVQALNDDALRFLGREHSAAEALDALRQARTLFDRVSFDLIYGRVGQTAAEWEAELTTALTFDLDHLSLYQLTIEQGTQFYTRHRKGEILSLSDDDMATLYDMTADITKQAGLSHYEVSNYAKEGAQSRHNLIYWQTGDWLGIGPGATGRYRRGGQRHEIVKRRSPTAYLQQIAERGHAIDSHYQETKEGYFEEVMMMGMRLKDGVPLSRLQDHLGLTSWPFASDRVRQLCEAGWLEVTDTHCRATDEGRLRLNYLLGQLLVSEA